MTGSKSSPSADHSLGWPLLSPKWGPTCILEVCQGWRQEGSGLNDVVWNIPTAPEVLTMTPPKPKPSPANLRLPPLTCHLPSFHPVAGSCEQRQAFLVQLATVKVGSKELIFQKSRSCVLSANCCFLSLRSQHRSQALFQPIWAEVAFQQEGDSKTGSIFHFMGTRHLRKSL